MLSRVTNQTIMASAQRNLQSSAAQLAKAQSQAMSLKVMDRPSDNPMAAAASLQVRAQAAAADQYGRNIDNGTSWLATIDTAMSNTNSLLNQVRDLTVQGGNGSLNQAAKDVLAGQLDSLKTDLLNQANTKFMGRNVFAGNSDATAAFVQTSAPGTGTSTVTYTGTPGAIVERRIGPDTTVRVDADGDAIFGSKGAAGSVFSLLDSIASDLRKGLDPTAHLTEVDARMTTVRGQQADMGARQAQILKAKDTNVELQGSLEANRAGIEDLDLGKAILDLQLQQVNYQAALAVTAKVLPQTLMDFLR
ncbi:flagellar hook-associated protein FlgL [Paenarthrobacter sp. Z7-10]|uniref:flagellar hook-associated protein FlgL n=1 Tax=Paenarthrobacter sp. Z7-10 TaxID=2787635 RepID=UPI0022A95E9C|nr:flagellar hook-associated protein FlgL [Paenarthrobacter sp. Z7-10]MCZ2403331.1 flagellar hook-associated protein FlgL [Paenarthrobacter sp. Z7-10]